MDTTIDGVLDRIRPRDRGRVSGLLRGLTAPGTEEQTQHITVSRVGGGGEESQVGRWEPADGVGLVDWIGTVLDGQAADAAPATAKVRIRGWYTGSNPGPGATAVLQPVESSKRQPVAALPVPARRNPPTPTNTVSASSPADPGSPRGDPDALRERIVALETRLAVALDGRRWYEEAHREARATIMELERELRQTHAALAEVLADRGALQRERDRVDRRLDRRDVRIRGLEQAVVETARERDEAIAHRDEIACERDELEEVADQAMAELRKRLGIPEDED